MNAFGSYTRGVASAANPTRQSHWKWTGLLAILSLVQAQDLTSSQDITYLECGGLNVTIPYCLRCAEQCVMECGGPEVVVPWCHPCQDECVDPPGQGTLPRKRLGEDGKPFIVGQWQLDTALAEPTEREMVWAGEVKWNVAPKKGKEDSAALCWAVKAEGGSDKLTYQLFKGLELKLSYAYSISDQLLVHELLGDQSVIYITATRASNVCHKIQQEKFRDSKISQMALNHAAHVLGNLFQCANKRANPEQLAYITDRLREWRRPQGPTMSIEEVMCHAIGFGRRLQAAIIEGRMVNREGLFTRAHSLNFDPVDLQTKGAYHLIDFYMSTADTMVPFYMSPHARAYTTQLVAAEQPESSAVDQESKDLLRRKRWQDTTRQLSLYIRVRLYNDAKLLLQKLELEWGPDWWSLYEQPIWENLSIVAQISEGLGEHRRACDFYKRALEAFDKIRHALKFTLVPPHAATRWHMSATESVAGFLSPQMQRAFSAIGRGKARSLLDLIEGSIPKPTADGGTASQWQHYKLQGTQLDTLRSLLSRRYEAQDLD
ncbi:tetratricopeptide repeat domain protein [Fusarium austroafricanum]|uniref:Tetratricopeptide repeat domain protein n=1 Tax=Fusarium austroafricanum TaxID=2364996 RepID=A0A8H4JNG9_9HYPO|nr:tetratricopeptide repeat domain protein [Fusarium austroafricanum]